MDLEAVAGRCRMCRFRLSGLLKAGIALAAFFAATGGGNAARAAKISWLDDLVREVIAETRAGSRAAIKSAEAARVELRAAGRLFLHHDAEEGLEQLVKHADDLARSGRRIEQPTEALLQSRFSRLLGKETQAARSFTALRPAEKRLVVELGEAAQRIARRYPEQAETMVRQLGPEGLTAVRVFGDDVAEVVVKEGSESLNVLRKTGRGGWTFFTKTILPHKKKLAAAGVLAAYLADPDKFVDYAGQATEYAVREFARAGISLASAAGSGVAQGLESSIGEVLTARGLNQPVFRYMGMVIASLVAISALFVLVGIPLRTMIRPVLWPFRLFGGPRKPISFEYPSRSPFPGRPRQGAE